MISVKRKKIKALFIAIEGISKYDPKDVYGVKTEMRFKYRSGKLSEPLIMLATNGKYCLPETKVIKDIITSIEPKDLRKEVILINREAGFPLLGINISKEYGTLLYVKTARGIILFKVELNPDEEETMTDEEFKALCGWANEAFGAPAPLK
jgi:hypothetical protein